VCNFVIPFPMLCLKRVRRSIPLILVPACSIVTGMYAERLLIVIPSLARRNDPFIWANYFPTWVEFSVMAGAAGMFVLLYMLFAKFFPIMAISEIKERLFHATDRTIGGTTAESIAQVEGEEEAHA